MQNENWHNTKLNSLPKQLSSYVSTVFPSWINCLSDRKLTPVTIPRGYVYTLYIYSIYIWNLEQ